jgi:tetratricopeptide (TPR) repeat protein
MRPRTKPPVQPRHPPTTPGAGLGALAWAGLGALALRLIYLAELRHAPVFAVLVGDGRQYDAWAREIAAGQWLGTEVFYQTPLYPYLLGVVFKLAGHHLLVVRAMQSVLGAASCVLLGLAGRRFFNPRAGLLAAVLLAVYPPAIFFDGLIQKSSLDLFLMTLLLALLGEQQHRPHWKWVVAAGAALGALTLNRENARILYPIIVVWLAGGGSVASLGRRAISAVVFTASLALIVLPVGLRNYHVGGEFLISTSQLGPNLYIGNHAGARGFYEPLVPDRGTVEYERLDATRLAEQATGRTLSPSDVSSYWVRRSLDDIRREPWPWLRLMGRKLLLTVNAAEASDTESIEVYSEYSHLLRGCLWISFGLMLPLAVFGAWHTRGEWRRLAVLYVMFAGLAASVAVFYVMARYRFPLVPIVVLFAAAGLSAIPAMRGPWRRWAPGLVLVVAAAVASNLRLGARADDTDVNLAAGLIQDGRPGDAIPLLRKAIAAAPDYAPPYYDLGVALGQIGEAGLALDQFAVALRLRPDYFEAHSALALGLQEAGRMPDALAHFREAARLKPDSAEAHTNLAQALAALGARPEAIAEYQASLLLKPDGAKAHNGLAGVWQQEGRIDEAIREYGAALAAKPDYAEAHNNLALALAARGDVTTAIEHFQEALRLESGQFGIHLNFADLLAKLGRTADAIPHYEQAVRLAPGSLQAQYSLAQAYARTGRLAEALVHLEQALAIANTSGQSAAAQSIVDAILTIRARIK